MNDAKPKTTGQTIYDAIVDLHNQEQVVTREVLRDTTGMRMSLIDDHIATMVADEKIRRVKAGVFVPVDTPPPARPISTTDMPDGMTILEIGDDVLRLTPREVRVIAARLGGQAAQFSSIQTGHEVGVLVMEMQTKMRKLERDLAACKEKLDPQPSLFATEH